MSENIKLSKDYKCPSFDLLGNADLSGWDSFITQITQESDPTGLKAQSQKDHVAQQFLAGIDGDIPDNGKNSILIELSSNFIKNNKVNITLVSHKDDEVTVSKEVDLKDALEFYKENQDNTSVKFGFSKGFLSGLKKQTEYHPIKEQFQELLDDSESTTSFFEQTKKLIEDHYCGLENKSKELLSGILNNANYINNNKGLDSDKKSVFANRNKLAVSFKYGDFTIISNGGTLSKWFNLYALGKTQVGQTVEALLDSIIEAVNTPVEFTEQELKQLSSFDIRGVENVQSGVEDIINSQSIDKDLKNRYILHMVKEKALDKKEIQTNPEGSVPSFIHLDLDLLNLSNQQINDVTKALFEEMKNILKKNSTVCTVLYQLKQGEILNAIKLAYGNLLQIHSYFGFLNFIVPFKPIIHQEVLRKLNGNNPTALYTPSAQESDNYGDLGIFPELNNVQPKEYYTSASQKQLYFKEDESSVKYYFPNAGNNSYAVYESKAIDQTQKTLPSSSNSRALVFSRREDIKTIPEDAKAHNFSCSFKK